MNGRNQLVQLVIDQLMKYLPILASHFVVGKIQRWIRLYLLIEFVVFGVVIGLGGLALCIALNLSLLLIIGYAIIGLIFTIGPPVAWLIIKREAPEWETEMASWLESRGRWAIDAF